MKLSNQIRVRLLRFVLPFILIISGCASPGNVEPTENQAQSSLITVASTVTMDATTTNSSSDQSTAVLIPVSGGTAENQSSIKLTSEELAVLQKLSLPTDAIIKYKDDFKSPSSGWYEGEADRYKVGYSGQNYYSVQILQPNTKYLENLPNKLKYDNVNIDLKVLTEKAGDCDFNYGLVFRRSGDKFYAFTISPVTGKWYVLKSSKDLLKKSSKDSLKILKEGTVKSLQGLNNADDNLRISLRGTSFFFVVNGILITQVSDSEYTSGEVGLFVQSHDCSDVQIDIDSIILWTVSVKNGLTGGPTAGLTPEPILVTVVPTSTLDCAVVDPGGASGCDYGYDTSKCNCAPPGAGICTDYTADNWKGPLPCTYTVNGCTDSSANNYEPAATVDDGSCTYDVLGCTDPYATNYDPSATVDDGSCVY